MSGVRPQPRRRRHPVLGLGFHVLAEAASRSPKGVDGKCVTNGRPWPAREPAQHVISKQPSREKGKFRTAAGRRSAIRSTLDRRSSSHSKTCRPPSSPIRGRQILATSARTSASSGRPGPPHRPEPMVEHGRWPGRRAGRRRDGPPPRQSQFDHRILGGVRFRRQESHSELAAGSQRPSAISLTHRTPTSTAL